jgi:small GTP-binding protein
MVEIRKVALIGDPAVGKTSLIRKFVIDKYEDKYISTIGAKVQKKEMNIDGTDMKFMLWDLLGQDDFQFLIRSALEGVRGAFIVFDLTRKETLEHIPKWVSTLFQTAGPVPLMFLGNKADLKDKVMVSEQEMQAVVGQFAGSLLLTSAKTGQNIEQAFHDLGKMLLNI